MILALYTFVYKDPIPSFWNRVDTLDGHWRGRALFSISNPKNPLFNYP